MKQLIKLDRPVIVEGKYDKITLENVVDALIIPTDGFRIFKNKEKCDMIRRLATEKGVIVLTDSDSAGAMIRSYLKKIIGDKKIINVYVPELCGKEKRKTKPSNEGLLGVEGMSREVIEKALLRSGVTTVKSESTPKVTKTDMFLYGLSGSSDSRLKRQSLLRFLDLPQTLSPAAMLDVINNMYTKEEFKEKIALWQDSSDKG